MKALVIGRGVQGKRWIKNLQKLGYSIEVYGRDYREKLQRNKYYNIIVIAVPHYAFLEVSEELKKRKIGARKVIIEKPGAKNLEEYMEIVRNLYYIGYSEMFLPLYIEYGFVEPKRITYIGKLDMILISVVDRKKEIVRLKNGRTIDLNTLRDLLWHPSSVYKTPYFNLEMRVISYPNYPEIYSKYILKNRGYTIIVGKDYREAVRDIDGKEIKFSNPMQKQLENDYEMLAIDKLPLSIWNVLNRLLQKQ